MWSVGVRAAVINSPSISRDVTCNLRTTATLVVAHGAPRRPTRRVEVDDRRT
jgi:hypothetical protein